MSENEESNTPKVEEQAEKGDYSSESMNSFANLLHTKKENKADNNDDKRSKLFFALPKNS